MSTSPSELIYRILSVELVYRVLSTLAIFVGTYIVGKAVEGVLKRALRRVGHPRAETFVVSASARYIILFLGLLAALENLAIPITPFLFAFGILVTIIGLASRNLIESLVSGFLLTASRPFEIGDLVMVEDTIGQVAEFDLMKVSLKTEDGAMHIIPNSTIANSGVTNLTALGNKFKVEMKIKLSYQSDLERTKLAILDIVNSYPSLSRDQPVSVDVEGLDEEGIYLELGFFVPSYSLKVEATSKVLEGLLQAQRDEKLFLAHRGV